MTNDVVSVTSPSATGVKKDSTSLVTFDPIFNLELWCEYQLINFRSFRYGRQGGALYTEELTLHQKL